MPSKDQQDWIARARELAPMIEAAAGRTEAERRIPGDVLAAMQAAGLFHMLLPGSLGGGAADLVTFNHVRRGDKAGQPRTFPRHSRSQNPPSLLT